MNATHPQLRSLALSRRGFLGIGIGTIATLALASCTPSPGFVQSDDDSVRRAEETRGGTGRVTTVKLAAAPSGLDLAGVVAATWSYGGVPAPVIRLGAGDTLRASLSNSLSADTSIHWHGIALRNDMDGVPPVTQAATAPDEEFTYEFVAPHPGTYFFHPHVGVQLDRGLYGALVVEDPSEPLAYDDEWVVVLDDWLDGVTTDPDALFAELSEGMGAMGDSEMFMRMGNTLMGATSDLLGGDAGDVYYPHYLVNGKPAGDPAVFSGSPGSRVRLRVVNAGSDTAFRVAMGGHALTVTHADGFPVDPVAVDSLLIGMGERYDVIVTLGDGAFPLVAQAEGKRARAFALVRTGAGTAPAPDVVVSELATDRVATAEILAASDAVRLENKRPDRELSLSLTGGMAAYDWGVDGRRFDLSKPLEGALTIRQGERVRLSIANDTKMWHPFHLHGHTYQHPEGGPRKDTSIILPGQTLTVDFDADNPGLWVAHCHNIYHAESGMTTVLGYQA